MAPERWAYSGAVHAFPATATNASAHHQVRVRMHARVSELPMQAFIKARFWRTSENGTLVHTHARARITSARAYMISTRAHIMCARVWRHVFVTETDQAAG